MGLTNLVRIFAFCALGTGLGSVNAVAAAPRYLLHSVDLLGYEGKALRIAVDMPCGGQFFGLVAQTDGKGTLQLAAAVRQDSILCSGLPEPVEMVVSYLDTTAFKTIAPMKIDEGHNRVRLTRTQDLRVSGKVDDRRLEAVYETKCGALLGTLIRQTSAKGLELGVVERPAAVESLMPAACSARTRTVGIKAIDLSSKFRLTAFQERTGSLRRAYYLRLAEVQPESLALAASDGLQLRYRRTCNEAPVGLVLRKESKLHVGMLVAHYYNQPCVASQAPETWESYQEAGLGLAKGQILTRMSSTADMQALRLLAPVSIDKQKKVSYIAGCRLPIGTVFARDRGDHLSIGVLDSGASTSCKTRPTEVSLAQPYLSHNVRPSDLVPLRLQGLPPS